MGCVLPEIFYRPHATFCLHPDLSCGSNIFIHALLQVSQEAQKEHGSSTPMHVVGRRVYEILADYFAGTEDGVCSQDYHIPLADTYPLPVRVYRELGCSEKTFFFYIHGGGWTRGNLYTHDTLCRKITTMIHMPVVAVDYRLSPEYPYPQGLDDVSELYQILQTKPCMFGLKDQASCLLGGDSGGGNFATSLIIRSLEKNWNLPKALVLLYPALDLRIPQTTDDLYANGFFLTQNAINDYVWDYLNHNLALTAVSEVSPLLMRDDLLAQFPPVVLINAQCDPLTHQGQEFAKRLEELRCPHKFLIVPKVLHAFAQFFTLYPEAYEALLFMKQSLKELEVI